MYRDQMGHLLLTGNLRAKNVRWCLFTTTLSCTCCHCSFQSFVLCRMYPRVWHLVVIWLAEERGPLHLKVTNHLMKGRVSYWKGSRVCKKDSKDFDYDGHGEYSRQVQSRNVDNMYWMLRLTETDVGIGQLLKGLWVPDKQFELDTVVKAVCEDTLARKGETQSQEILAVPRCRSPSLVTVLFCLFWWLSLVL